MGCAPIAPNARNGKRSVMKGGDAVWLCRTRVPSRHPGLDPGSRSATPEKRDPGSSPVDDDAGARPQTTSRNFRKARQPTVRSEEHTSELQSLMRISYAVFCLKKKNQTKREYICTTHVYNS